MLNIELKTCAKNVNNQRVLVSIISGQISTKKPTTLFYSKIQVGQTRLSTTDLPNLSSILSTYQNPTFNLLNKSFTLYPQHLLLKLLNEN